MPGRGQTGVTGQCDEKKKKLSCIPGARKDDEQFYQFNCHIQNSSIKVARYLCSARPLSQDRASSWVAVVIAVLATVFGAVGFSGV